MALSKTMRYYKSPAGKASYRRKLKKDAQRSMTKAGKAKRAELKRIRERAVKRGVKVKGKDYDHGSKRFIKSSVNRGKRSGTNGDAKARGKKGT